MNNVSPINIQTCCRQTYDRSTSAHTSRQESHRHYASLSTIRNKINQSTPTNIISNIENKLGTNTKDNIKREKNRDYLITSNTLKYHSTPTNSFSTSDIYIKLSDCQNACRRWAIKYKKKKQTKKYSHRKRKLPICYRNFPLSFNAQSKSAVQIKIQKISCENKHTDDKAHKSLICFGTGAINFIDGPDGPILCLNQEDSTNDKQIDLYRHISNDEIDYSSEDDESCLDSDSRSTSSKSVISSYIFEKEKIYNTNIEPEVLLLNEIDTCIMYQCLSEVTILLNIGSACIFTMINSISRIQTASLPLIITELDNTNQWQYKTLFNISITTNTKTEQENSKSILDDIVIKQSDRDSYIENENTDSSNDKISELLSFTNEQILEDDPTKIFHPIQHDSERWNEVDSLKATANEAILYSDHQSISKNKETQLLRSFEELSIETKQSSDKISSLLTDLESGTNHLVDSQRSTTTIEEQQIFDESFIATPTCVQLHHSFEQIININSDRLLSTSSLSHDKNSTFSKHHMLQNSDNDQEGKTDVAHQSDLKINDDTYQMNDINHEEKISLSKTQSSNVKYPPLMSISHLKRKTLPGIFRIKLRQINIQYFVENTDVHSLQDSSETMSSELNTTVQYSNEKKQSNDKLKPSRIMIISRKPVNNTIQDKKSNPLNQISYLHADSSFSIQANSTPCKRTNKSSVIRKKRIHKNQIYFRPPWVSTYTNSPTKKPRNRSSLKQLKDPCQVLDVYTQLKRIDCTSICNPLPSCSFMRNADIRNVYLM
ncbi:unnamed protein product [Adineta steineri]|uniref:Uncharacterized protein n=1 Tax=Adineta steineri TaxID=433720 RepID=A0A815CUX1_9BILA|nr:unnamed protein product [Adineta steineri]CAF1331552.1 unnamed protein product [Adineta steineri]